MLRKNKYGLLCMCLVSCYAILYNQIVDHGGLLPENFQVIQDISEYFAILKVFRLSSIVLLIFMIICYVSLFKRRIKNKTASYKISKFCYIVTLAVFVIILSGIIAFKQSSHIGTTDYTVILVTHLLSILFMKKNMISVLFLFIAIFPILDFRSSKQDDNVKYEEENK